MHAVVGNAAGITADVFVFGGSGALLVSLAQLTGELYGSKQMCQDLIKDIESIQPHLKEMVESDNIKVKTALTKYHELLTDVHSFLEKHVNSNSLRRTLRHWQMKKRVQCFYTDLNNIKELASLDFQLESGNRHTQVIETLERNRRLDKQDKQALEMEIESLRSFIENMPDEFMNKLRREGITLTDLADLKKELKYNSDAYTKTDNETLLAVLKKMSKLMDVKVPHITSWYLSRSDICFDDRDPFAASELRNLYHGTLYSGTKVTVKVVNATLDDEQTLKKFNAEVETWYNLRDPHVLPLYGATNVGYPLLFVSGRAELGNFNEYLAANRHRVWHVFLDAARGLAYLHKKKRVHGNLKCNNLLVTAHGVGVVSDFEFTFERDGSALSVKSQAPSYFWKAPECFDRRNPNPRFESDVYSLGMCLFEALAGIKPYGGENEQEAIRKIKNGDLPTRPVGEEISNEVWELISKMCARQYARRIKLSEVISVLETLTAHEELQNRCLPCACAAPCCLHCGRQVKVAP